MTTRWDIAVYDRNEQLVLVSEIKNKLDAAPEWAGRLRRNILAHGIYPDAPFFLIAFPNRFYLWASSKETQSGINPDYIIDARPILQPYFEKSQITPEQISSQSLELIVTAWLSAVIHSERLPEDFSSSEHWLIDSGLYAAIVGGRFEHEVLA
ncbi:MAG: hypothetical protein H7Z42_06090 [Roseiflexaceae bacterium]|nr:hypothetical protein [Roseiflexaceae bacterium]